METATLTEGSMIPWFRKKSFIISAIVLALTLVAIFTTLAIFYALPEDGSPSQRQGMTAGKKSAPPEALRLCDVSSEALLPILAGDALCTKDTKALADLDPKILPSKFELTENQHKHCLTLIGEAKIVQFLSGNPTNAPQAMKDLINQHAKSTRSGRLQPLKDQLEALMRSKTRHSVDCLVAALKAKDAPLSSEALEQLKVYRENRDKAEYEGLPATVMGLISSFEHNMEAIAQALHTPPSSSEEIAILKTLASTYSMMLPPEQLQEIVKIVGPLDGRESRSSVAKSNNDAPPSSSAPRPRPVGTQQSPGKSVRFEANVTELIDDDPETVALKEQVLGEVITHITDPAEFNEEDLLDAADEVRELLAEIPNSLQGTHDTFPLGRDDSVSAIIQKAIATNCDEIVSAFKGAISGLQSVTDINSKSDRLLAWSFFVIPKLPPIIEDRRTNMLTTPNAIRTYISQQLAIQVKASLRALPAEAKTNPSHPQIAPLLQFILAAKAKFGPFAEGGLNDVIDGPSFVENLRALSWDQAKQTVMHSILQQISITPLPSQDSVLSLLTPLDAAWASAGIAADATLVLESATLSSTSGLALPVYTTPSTSDPLAVKAHRRSFLKSAVLNLLTFHYNQLSELDDISTAVIEFIGLRDRLHASWSIEPTDQLQLKCREAILLDLTPRVVEKFFAEMSFAMSAGGSVALSKSKVTNVRNACTSFVHRTKDFPNVPSPSGDDSGFWPAFNVVSDVATAFDLYVSFGSSAGGPLPFTRAWFTANGGQRDAIKKHASLSSRIQACLDLFSAENAEASRLQHQAQLRRELTSVIKDLIQLNPLGPLMNYKPRLGPFVAFATALAPNSSLLLPTDTYSPNLERAELRDAVTGILEPASFRGFIGRLRTAPVDQCQQATSILVALKDQRADLSLLGDLLPGDYFEDFYKVLDKEAVFISAKCAILSVQDTQAQSLLQRFSVSKPGDFYTDILLPEHSKLKMMTPEELQLLIDFGKAALDLSDFYSTTTIDASEKMMPSKTFAQMERISMVLGATVKHALMDQRLEACGLLYTKPFDRSIFDRLASVPASPAVKAAMKAMYDFCDADLRMALPSAFKDVFLSLFSRFGVTTRQQDLIVIRKLTLQALSNVYNKTLLKLHSYRECFVKEVIGTVVALDANRQKAVNLTMAFGAFLWQPNNMRGPNHSDQLASIRKAAAKYITSQWLVDEFERAPEGFSSAFVNSEDDLEVSMDTLTSFLAHERAGTLFAFHFFEDVCNASQDKSFAILAHLPFIRDKQLDAKGQNALYAGVPVLCERVNQLVSGVSQDLRSLNIRDFNALNDEQEANFSYCKLTRAHSDLVQSESFEEIYEEAVGAMAWNQDDSIRDAASSVLPNRIISPE